jgi:hypothetical protein
MSFTIIKDIDGFFAKFFTKATAAQKVLATVGALAPLVEAALSVEDPAAAPVVEAAFTEVQTDLATFQSIVKQSDQVSPSCRKQNPSRAGAKGQPLGRPAASPGSAGKGLAFRYGVDFRGSYRGRSFCTK